MLVQSLESGSPLIFCNVILVLQQMDTHQTSSPQVQVKSCPLLLSVPFLAAIKLLSTLNVAPQVCS